MFSDLKHALRVLLGTKGWTTVVVLSLAVGIGANTALFSSINGLYLDKLPVKDPDALVRLRAIGRNQMATSSSDYGFSTKVDGLDVQTTFSYPMFQQFVADNRTMSDLFACAPIGRLNVVVNGAADVASGFISTGNYFRVLGISAALGRTIGPDDDRTSAVAVAVISTRYWRSRFGSNRDVIGSIVHVNNVPVTIIGVLPSDFTGVQQTVGEVADLSFPLSLEPQINIGSPAPNSSAPRAMQPTFWWLEVIGRLKPGVTAAQVSGNLEAVFQQTARSGLDAYLASQPESVRSSSTYRNRRDVPKLIVDSASRGVYDINTTDARAVAILSAVVTIVLLIVCANVANLLLARATNRQKELAIRLSLGATRARVVRQLLTESLLLASIGGVGGYFVGVWTHQLLPALPGRPVHLDWRAFAYMTTLTTIAGIVVGIVPAIRGSGVNVNASLKESGRGVVRTRSLLSKGLLVLQVALSIVLLIGAGLFLRTVQNLHSVDVGFNPRNLLLFGINPQLNGYDEKRTAALYESVTEGVSAVAGVRSVAFSLPALLTGNVNGTSIFVSGHTYSPEQRDSINRMVVSPSFFDTLEIPIVVGRTLSSRDDERAPKVALINQAAAAKYFPHSNPLGQRFGSSIEDSTQLEVVGVVRDVKYNSVRNPAPPTMYVPFRQTRPSRTVFNVRTMGDPLEVLGAIREAVRQVDHNIPLMDITTQADAIDTRLVQERLFARSYAVFGGTALLLASIGLFGLMSYSVSRRVNEIGIRMALGAQRSTIGQMVMRESLALVVIGVIVGIFFATAAGQVVASQLYGLAPHDLPTSAIAILVMVVVSAVAAYWPARRASRVDPLAALQCE